MHTELRVCSFVTPSADTAWALLCPSPSSWLHSLRLFQNKINQVHNTSVSRTQLDGQHTDLSCSIHSCTFHETPPPPPRNVVCGWYFLVLLSWGKQLENTSLWNTSEYFTMYLVPNLMGDNSQDPDSFLCQFIIWFQQQGWFIKCQQPPVFHSMVVKIR